MSIFDNLKSPFMVIKDGNKYFVLDKTTKVTYTCSGKKRAFELAKKLNDN